MVTRVGLPHTLWASLLIFFLSSPAAAQFEGTLRLTTEFGFCTLLDNSPGMRTLQVSHLPNPGTISSRFRIVADPGVTMTYVSETIHVASWLGNTKDGIALCYGSCLGGDNLLVTVNYMSFGTSDNCSHIRIVPHPDAETVDAVRCDAVPVGSFVQDLYVQAVPGDCGCPLLHTFEGRPSALGCTPTPVQTTTWGGIKALYMN
jgi:hypothetical protein